MALRVLSSCMTVCSAGLVKSMRSRPWPWPQGTSAEDIAFVAAAMSGRGPKRSRVSIQGLLGLTGLRGGVRLARVELTSIREPDLASADRSSIAVVLPGIGSALVAVKGTESSLESGGGNCRGGKRGACGSGNGDRNISDSCNGSENTDESTGRAGRSEGGCCAGGGVDSSSSTERGREIGSDWGGSKVDVEPVGVDRPEGEDRGKGRRGCDRVAVTATSGTGCPGVC